jgi:dihydrofolate reductase
MLQQRGLRGGRHDHVWSQNLRRNGPAVDGNRRPPPHHGETLTEGGIAFGKQVRDMDRVVVSTTMENAGHNVLLIRDDIAQRIIALKAHTGSDILLYCGPRLVSTLTELGLIDEYMLYVNPIVLGQGTQLFGNIKGELQLKLLKTKIFGSEVVLKLSLLKMWSAFVKLNLHEPDC